MPGKRLVVVGNGMVGQRFAERIIADQGPVAGREPDTGHVSETDRVSDTDPDLSIEQQRWSVTIIGDEPRQAYDRVALSTWFDGATEESLSVVSEGFPDRADVEYLLGSPVAGIDADNRTVALADGTVVDYDELVLVTGSYPFVPPIPGHDRPGCFVYRTIEDLQAIGDWVEQVGCRSGVVIGGGLLGLEAAAALQNLGLQTSVVEMAPQLMPQQLDPAGGEMLARWIAERGVDLHLGASTASIQGDPVGGEKGDLSPVRHLRFADDSRLATDIVVFSAGVRPRDDLARTAGLAVGDRGGIVVDDHLATDTPGIWAIGEVACHRGMTYGLVAPGYDMASVLAARLNGDTTATFSGADLSAKLKLLGVEVASFSRPPATVGSSVSTEPVTDELVFADPLGKIHRRLVVDRETGELVSGTLVGDSSGYELLRSMALGQVPTPSDLAGYVLPESIAPAGSDDVPDAMHICTCNAVTAGDIRDAVACGHTTLPCIKQETTAGTGCAGCIPAVTALLKDELRKAGVEVSDRICEHFDYSRQALFDLIRFHRYTTWSEVLDSHGSGYGCEVCRPAVASILASLDSGYILDGDQGAIQDTNDHVLANMQRNGTYSVVPRVPGGEITPDQLIKIGQVAKEFDLYTKITGAQRIDLFGAQLHELPQIWSQVREVGLESGHAYGKALRTVKSCVGSTWCRYGVQDSVGMAIAVELRYRGLRAPHKIKMAVSGCTRECAEAQSKDVGIIATETGWNLYVCGNGGKKPRHADLLATDLTDEELIRTIDRFLMFYIRTADRLERTSVWFEKLDGGLDYLKDVVFDDVLGIAEELEADMERHVERYECEWAATLDDPDRLANYVEFVNAPEVASTPVWITERDQRVPAP